MQSSESAAARSLFAVRLRLAGVLLAAALLGSLGEGRGVCISDTLFDFNCPGCGLTRALGAVIHANVTVAASLNPAIFAVIVVTPCQVLLACPAARRLGPWAPRIIAMGDTAVSGALLGVFGLRVIGLLPTV
jgi:hypothetical protein